MFGWQAAFRWMLWLIILVVAVQFLLAGTGMMAGESIDPHVQLGRVLELLGVLLLVLAFVGKQPRGVIAMSTVLLILFILQAVWANIEDPRFLRALHVFDAFLIVGLLTNLAARVGFPIARHSRQDVRG